MSYPFCCIVLTHHFDALPQSSINADFGVFHGFKVVSPHFADLPKLPLLQPIKVSGEQIHRSHSLRLRTFGCVSLCTRCRVGSYSSLLIYLDTSSAVVGAGSVAPSLSNAISSSISFSKRVSRSSSLFAVLSCSPPLQYHGLGYLSPL